METTSFKWEHMQAIDAVVLAGTHRNPRRLVLKKNKCFLKLQSKPVIQYVIEALAQAKRIKRVFVVGPQEELLNELKTCQHLFIAVPERGSFLQNAWIGYKTILEYAPSHTNIEQILGLLGSALPEIKPYTRLSDKHEIVATIAFTMRFENRQQFPLYRLEKLVDQFYIRKRQHGFQISSAQQDRMIRALLADQRIFSTTNGEIAFRDSAIEQYFFSLGRWIHKPVLFLTGDIPLITPACIEDFLDRCYPFDQDFYFGMTEERDLHPYYPDKTRSGITRPLLQFHEYRARAANINLIKPKRIGNVSIVQQSFNVRKLKEWENVIKLIRILYRAPGGFKAIRYVSFFQLATLLTRWRRDWFARQIRRFVPVFKAETLVSKILQTDFKIVLSPYGGVSIDIDNEEDYRVLSERYDEWIALQYQISKTIGIQTSNTQSDSFQVEDANE